MTAPQDTVFLLDVDNTLKIVLKNTGKQMYELVIGTKKELDERAALMVKFPVMEHDELYMAHVVLAKQAHLPDFYKGLHYEKNSPSLPPFWSPPPFTVEAYRCRLQRQRQPLMPPC